MCIGRRESDADLRSLDAHQSTEAWEYMARYDNLPSKVRGGTESIEYSISIIEAAAENSSWCEGAQTVPRIVQL